MFPAGAEKPSGNDGGKRRNQHQGKAADQGFDRFGGNQRAVEKIPGGSSLRGKHHQQGDIAAGICQQQSGGHGSDHTSADPDSGTDQFFRGK